MQRYILHAHLQGKTHLQAEEQTVEQKAAHSLAERREGGGNAREWRIRRVSAGERERSPGSQINAVVNERRTRRGRMGGPRTGGSRRGKFGIFIYKVFNKRNNSSRGELNSV